MQVLVAPDDFDRTLHALTVGDASTPAGSDTDAQCSPTPRIGTEDPYGGGWHFWRAGGQGLGDAAARTSAGRPRSRCISAGNPTPTSRAGLRERSPPPSRWCRSISICRRRLGCSRRITSWVHKLRMCELQIGTQRLLRQRLRRLLPKWSSRFGARHTVGHSKMPRGTAGAGACRVIAPASAARADEPGSGASVRRAHL